MGDIIEIPLGNNRFAYARLFYEGTLAIYKGIFSEYDKEITKENYYRYIAIYSCDLSKLCVVDSVPFKDGEDIWPPDKVVIDQITGKGSLYHHGEILECSYEECKNLEVAAVWHIEHIVDMLNGDSKWDVSIGKPKNI